MAVDLNLIRKLIISTKTNDSKLFEIVAWLDPTHTSGNTFLFSMRHNLVVQKEALSN